MCIIPSLEDYITSVIMLLYYVFGFAFFSSPQIGIFLSKGLSYILNNPPAEPGRSSEALDTSYFSVPRVWVSWSIRLGATRLTSCGAAVFYFMVYKSPHCYVVCIGAGQSIVRHIDLYDNYTISEIQCIQLAIMCTRISYVFRPINRRRPCIPLIGKQWTLYYDESVRYVIYIMKYLHNKNPKTELLRPRDRILI